MNIKKIAATMAMTLLVSSAAIASAAEAAATPPDASSFRLAKHSISFNQVTEGDHYFVTANDADNNAVTIRVMPSDFRALAEKLGLDISGLSDEEIEATVQEHMQARHEELMALPREERELKLLQEAAEEAGIDHNGMDIEALRAALEAEGISISFFDEEDGLMVHTFNIDSASISDLADEYGIDTTDMSEEEIKSAIEAKQEEELQALEAMSEEERQTYFLSRMAKRAGIDTTGMTVDEMEAALEEAGIFLSASTLSIAELDPEFYTRMAAEYDIDSTDMNEEEIKAAVKAKLEEERAHISTLSPEEQSRYWKEKMARRFGIDPNGMSEEELDAALAEQNIQLHFAVEETEGEFTNSMHSFTLSGLDGEKEGEVRVARLLPAWSVHTITE